MSIIFLDNLFVTPMRHILSLGAATNLYATLRNVELLVQCKYLNKILISFQTLKMQIRFIIIQAYLREQNTLDEMDQWLQEKRKGFGII